MPNNKSIIGLGPLGHSLLAGPIVWDDYLNAIIVWSPFGSTVGVEWTPEESKLEFGFVVVALARDYHDQRQSIAFLLQILFDDIETVSKSSTNQLNENR